MQSVSNISSEEELLKLREEGKISEDEYKDLLAAMRETASVDTEQACEYEPRAARTSGLAIASLVFSLLGPIGWVPAIFCGHLALRKIQRRVLIRGRGLALAGLIIGYTMLGLSIPVALLFVGYDMVQMQPRETIVMSESVKELRRFPLDDLDGILSQSGLQIDKDVSSDGNGSVRIDVTGPVTIHLFEIEDIDVENATLFYQAQLRTVGVKCRVYLEMVCTSSDRRELSSTVNAIGQVRLEMAYTFSRQRELSLKGPGNPVTDTMEWTTRHVGLFLKEGDNPENVKLNLVIEGEGTVWIDDIRLLEGPCP
jgi:hypothetical protein